MLDREQRVLLVDDDATVGNFAHDILTLLGYEVVVTTRSQEALATFQGAPQSFAALITDSTMPGLSGLALATACRQLRVDLPIILCTDTPTGSAAQAAPQGIDAVLAKPFFPVELAYTVEKVLAAHHGASTP
jgi:CheY-like chemotaxis protein